MRSQTGMNKQSGRASNFHGPQAFSASSSSFLPLHLLTEMNKFAVVGAVSLHFTDLQVQTPDHHCVSPSSTFSSTLAFLSSDQHLAAIIIPGKLNCL